MVRLKGSLFILFSYSKIISIPYGAIKSLSLVENFYKVAIAFQFLMVRLKVVSERKINAFSPISIPYGAIKSVVGGKNRFKPAHFNSLWCD